jgi:hypothetical protein
MLRTRVAHRDHEGYMAGGIALHGGGAAVSADSSPVRVETIGVLQWPGAMAGRKPWCRGMDRRQPHTTASLIVCGYGTVLRNDGRSLRPS